jgi:hypothetical protein
MAVLVKELDNTAATIVRRGNVNIRKVFGVMCDKFSF